MYVCSVPWLLQLNFSVGLGCLQSEDIVNSLISSLWITHGCVFTVELGPRYTCLHFPGLSSFHLVVTNDVLSPMHEVSS